MSKQRRYNPSISDKIGIINKLNEKTKIVDGHWLWFGAKSSFGHGILRIDNINYRVHRLSLYCYKNFDLGDDLLALHKNECHIPNCWNPEHLYIGTQGSNMEDVHNIIQSQPMFPCGHLRSGRNLVTRSNGHNYCRECSISRLRKLRGSNIISTILLSNVDEENNKNIN